MKIVLFVGGVGGAKLAYGLANILPSEDLTIIVNTGDDFWHYGLRICPDLDTIMYTLSGHVNPAFGWGVVDDTFHTLEALEKFGDAPWFKLGDRDLATHMMRTHMLRQGHSLTSITKHLASSLDIGCTMVPMSDSPVATRIDTFEHGKLDFQEYFVKHRWQPHARSLHYDGADRASISAAVFAAIQDADALVIGPSNPWLSIAPILAVNGMRDLILGRAIPRIAVTPIIQGAAVKGPTAKLMREFNLEVSTRSVVEYYGDVINGFVYDGRDNDLDVAIRSTALDTLMDTNEKRNALAQNVLEWLIEWT